MATHVLFERDKEHSFYARFTAIAQLILNDASRIMIRLGTGLPESTRRYIS